MFFVISKILAFLITPLFWIMLILLWAILTKSQVRRKRLLILGFILMYLLSNQFLFNEVIQKWEGQVAETQESSSAYDIGIVLGGFARYDTVSHRLQLNESGDRIWQALYLYRTGKVKKLLISGGAGSILHQKVTEADRVAEFLIRTGISEKDIMVDANSRNTRENAVESAKLINTSYPDARCLLVTSAFHMKRAMGCYQKVHLDVTPYKTDFMSEQRKWDPDILLLPDPKSLMGWNKLVREIIGLYAYKIAGYM